MILKKRRIPKQKTHRQLVKELDEVMSKLCKKIGNYTCIRCKKQYPENSKQLTTSHFWSRKSMGARFELENLDVACYPCHMFQLEKDKQGWYRDYMIKKLGQRGYDYLEVKARSITKFSRSDLEFMIDLAKSDLKGSL
jgi:5-methylcytosine-specific restriction endonuclease McrA